MYSGNTSRSRHAKLVVFAEQSCFFCIQTFLYTSPLAMRICCTNVKLIVFYLNGNISTPFTVGCIRCWGVLCVDQFWPKSVLPKSRAGTQLSCWTTAFRTIDIYLYTCLCLGHTAGTVTWPASNIKHAMFVNHFDKPFSMVPGLIYWNRNEKCYYCNILF